MGEAITVHVVAGVLLKREDRFLLVQEGEGAKKGLWNWPAGKVDEGYTLEETAVKEAKEETGYNVKLIREIGIFHEGTKEAVKHLFYAEIIGGELNFPKDEIMNAKWFSFEEIKQIKNLRGNWILEGIKIY